MESLEQGLIEADLREIDSKTIFQEYDGFHGIERRSSRLVTNRESGAENAGRMYYDQLFASQNTEEMATNRIDSKALHRR